MIQSNKPKQFGKAMFTNNPNSTPIWLYLIYAAVFAFGTPRIKRLVSKYVSDSGKQNLFTFIIMVMIGVVIVTLSVVIDF